MLRASLTFAFSILTLSVSHAGLFDLTDYYTGGTLTQGVGYVDFDEKAGTAAAFEAGDIVIWIQDFTNVAGGVGGPAAVYGVTAFKAKTSGYTDTSGTVSQSARYELEATGDFSTILSNLGSSGVNLADAATDGITFGANSAFALLSSDTDVTLLSNGTTDFSSFEVDLVAGFDGTDDFAQAFVNGNDEFLYAFYNPGDNPGGSAFSFKLGLSVESVGSSDVASFGTTSATPTGGSSASVQLTTLATQATSSAESYTGGSAYYGDLDADLKMISTVPEPSSLAVLGSLGLFGALRRRRRN
jgi:hypothetical protein